MVLELGLSLAALVYILQLTISSHSEKAKNVDKEGNYDIPVNFSDDKYSHSVMSTPLWKLHKN